jgi:small subunit ribosomal protein S17
MGDIQTSERGVRKEMKGVVVSRSGDKSVVVLAERRFRHPVYGKVVRQSKKFHVHDEKNETKVGDLVSIVESRPVSRLKRWRIVEVLEKASLQNVDEAI